MKVLSQILVCFLFACVSLANETWIVREDGVGPIKIGMSVNQLNSLLRERFKLPETKGEQACFYVKPTRHPQLAFMIEDGRLSRVDIDSRGVPAQPGVQVGDSEALVLKAYGTR